MTTSLKLLPTHEKALETCAYCPKLCRTACPVSNADRRETLTPWGKMSATWLAARGTVPLSRDVAAVAWACTGCLACRDSCDHENPVAATLLEARVLYRELGLAPQEVQDVRARFDARRARAREVLRALRELPGVEPGARTVLALGSEQLVAAHSVSADIVRVAVGLSGPVRLLEACCGLPLLLAGDRPGFEAEQAHVERELEGADALLAAEPSCARALAKFAPEMLLARAHRSLSQYGRVARLADVKLRWHDPCHLGRGLGLFDEPRALLARALGRQPEEFSRVRERGECSGGGGLLPLTAPETSAEIANSRLRDHEALGGGTVVTACASSLRRFRHSGANAVDLHSILVESMASAR